MNIDELKRRIDLEDLAMKLELERPRASGNFRSPFHKDKNASISIYHAGEDQRWKDWSNDGVGGTCIDLVMYVKGMEVGDAIKWLHDIYGFPLDRAQRPEEAPRKRTMVEYIADNCMRDPEPAVAYLRDERKIPEEVIRRGIKARTIGFNTWTADLKPKEGREPIKPGEPNYGGPAVAFIVYRQRDLQAISVEMRYLDPELNGGVKTQTQGEKVNAPWCLDWKAVDKARTIYLVEAPINALSIESCGMKRTAAVAIRGTGVVDGMDWRFLQGKRVVLAMDNDEPNQYGKRPGLEAAWKIYDHLVGLGIACHLVEQIDWKKNEWNDVNDILKASNPAELEVALKNLQPWIIPGQPGRHGEDVDTQARTRVFLPPHDFSQYWRFRAKEDFVTYIKEYKKDDDGQEKIESEDLCGFRLAGISRVTIAGPTATLTGEEDTQAKTLFSVSVQAPRHGDALIRRVFEDEKLHNTDQWQKFGPIFSKTTFQRMISLLERTADRGKRKAVNFVGIAWLDGKPVVNQGPDCYFSEPEKQCPYHNLTFPSGSQEDARRVLGLYSTTFKHNAALIMLCWALGGHLKAFTGFWPHCIVQARKGSGKSTLIKRLERTIGMLMFSGQSIMTEFRMLTSLSATSHPVGWEEISARRQDMIDRAVSLLQEAYQHGYTKRGSEMTEYLISAPVLLAGEDVPVNSLIGKAVAVDLAVKGPMLPEDMPRFPVRQWLEFLAGKDKEAVRKYYADAIRYCNEHCSAEANDAGAKRMVQNYAAVLCAWYMLADFADLDSSIFNFSADLVARMNSNIMETTADREPWVWIMEKLLAEIASRNFKYPYVIDSWEGKTCLIVRTSHVMHHLSGSPNLRQFYDGLTVKSDRVFKRQLKDAGVVATNMKNEFVDVEKTINDMRVAHMTPLDIHALEKFGLSVPQEVNAGAQDPVPQQRGMWAGRGGGR